MTRMDVWQGVHDRLAVNCWSNRQGYLTLMTTSLPLCRNVARCTCAMLAEFGFWIQTLLYTNHSQQTLDLVH